MTTPPSAARVLGIVGGIGPESTIDYYRSLIAAGRRRRPDGRNPRVIIGGTELALTLTEPAYAAVPILNTAQIHVEAAVDWLLGG